MTHGKMVSNLLFFDSFTFGVVEAFLLFSNFTFRVSIPVGTSWTQAGEHSCIKYSQR